MWIVGRAQFRQRLRILAQTWRRRTSPVISAALASAAACAASACAAWSRACLNHQTGQSSVGWRRRPTGCCNRANHLATRQQWPFHPPTQTAVCCNVKRRAHSSLGVTVQRGAARPAAAEGAPSPQLVLEAVGGAHELRALALARGGGVRRGSCAPRRSLQTGRHRGRPAQLVVPRGAVNGRCGRSVGGAK
jgi:hypothetical protein